MEENELIELLAAQPRSGASDGFTGRTLARLDERPRAAGSMRRYTAAAAIALAILSGVAGHRAWRDHQRVEALREEHRRLEAELQQIEQVAAGYEPVVYVGGDEKTDYVVDLRPPAPRAGANRTMSEKAN